MDLKQLKYFRAIVDQGSFRKAADALHISPPALSLSIKGLEEELGITLLERKPGQILTTPFGRSLYNSAIDIQKTVQQALDQLNEIKGIGSGKLSIGILPYGIPAKMGELVGRFNDRYPNLEVRIALGSATYLRERVRSGELDFLIGEIDDSLPASEFEQEPLFKLRYGLLAGSTHPLAGKRNLSLKRVMEYKIAFSRTWRKVLKNWNETFISEGLEPPRPAMGEATDHFFINMISNCNTVAVLPMIGTFKDAIASGQICELHVPKVDWSSTVALVYRAGEGMLPNARLLRDETRLALSDIAT